MKVPLIVGGPGGNDDDDDSANLVDFRLRIHQSSSPSDGDEDADTLLICQESGSHFPGVDTCANPKRRKKEEEEKRMDGWMGPPPPPASPHRLIDIDDDGTAAGHQLFVLAAAVGHS